MRTAHLAGLSALVVGAAREGLALSRALAAWGAFVTLNDSKPAEQLTRALGGLEGWDVRLLLGQAQPDLEGYDVLFISPGVPPTAPVVRAARERGLPISSQLRLFTQISAGTMVGITGSSGKTTTTSLVGEMLSAAGLRTWVGGNIGAPMITRLLDEGQPEVAVMELSSFQLELFSPDYQGPTVASRRSLASLAVALEGWSPHVSAITNITPNHLDRHPSMEDYARCKWQILAYQQPEDWAILNRDNAWTRQFATQVRGRLMQFSLVEPVEQGAFLRDDELVLRQDGVEQVLARRRELRLRGLHNVANVLTAACCAAACYVPIEVQHYVATRFAGVPHRLEVVRVLNGVTWVNDSIATSPERAIAALRAYDEPVVLLAGGRDKHLPWEEWADLAGQKARLVIGFGEAAALIERALAEARARNAGQAPAWRAAATLDEAVALCADLARPGEVALLSPGGTSFDAFVDFEARGERFRALVRAL